ncbi:glycosyltransferase family 2 protein [Clostridium sp. D53t1_180928_C8]|uniref:glycosyltransferase family 2 protein n=1 Tax=Clostridium sp. D53t1_180928_C8 TaxID=2787101 RepID=UPI0018AC01A9|nr:glycosyltransferase family 2 protein [Clostridium sp. D53t1_180928_C8]
MKISVVIPVYNSGKYLKRCIESIRNQKYDKWEVIAIDDGSSDNSYKILKEYSIKDKRIKVYTQKNQGPGAARNKGIEYATGKYIVFIDSDDYIEEYYFEEINKCIIRNNSDIIFIDIIQEDTNGNILKNELMSKYKECSKDMIIRHQMTGKLPWGGVRKVVRTSLVKANNIRYSGGDVGEEALFSFRILYNSEIISFVDKICYHYVNHPDSQSKKGNDDPWGGVCNNLCEYLKSEGIIKVYEKTINSFAITALLVSINRISQNYSFFEALSKGKNALNNFKENYGFNIDLDSLEYRVKVILPMIKANMIWAIIVVAKIKGMVRR